MTDARDASAVPSPTDPTPDLADFAAPSPLEVDLGALPKISLHDHLDGGLRPVTVLELARQVGHELPGQSADELAVWFAESANAGTLERYLETFDHTLAVMQTAEGLHRVAREFVEDLVTDGVVYAEIRWAPEQHTAGGLGLDEAVEAVQAGLEEAMDSAEAAGTPIQAGQLITAMRQNERSQEIAELAVRHRDRGASGFDIAGPEIGFSPARFSEAFTWLAEQSFPVTVHAGESAGLDSIRDALVHGRALRLGHGVRIADDISVDASTGLRSGPRAASSDTARSDTASSDPPSSAPAGGLDADALPEGTALADVGLLASWVRDRGIALEICPSSNLQTGAVEDYGGTITDHPVDMLHQLGFRVTINPDNRLMSGISLTDELYLLAETFDYSLEDLLDLQLNAAEAAFLPVDERGALVELLVESWGRVISGEASGAAGPAHLDVIEDD